MLGRTVRGPIALPIFIYTIIIVYINELYIGKGIVYSKTGTTVWEAICLLVVFVAEKLITVFENESVTYIASILVIKRRVTG